MSAINPNRLRFWAKTTPAGLPGLDVFPHTRNVGFVAALLAQAKRPMLDHFGLAPSAAAVLAALHDIGKISEGFQSKCPAWLSKYKLEGEAKRKGWLEKGRCERKHDRVSQFTVYRLLCRHGMSDSSAASWAVAVGAHHGRPYRSDDRGLSETCGMCDDEWEIERQRVAEKLIACIGALPQIEIERNSPLLWWLAGLISVSDWIGSDENFFDNNRAASKEKSRGWAEQAIDSIGFSHPSVSANLDFAELFKLEVEGKKSEPNALQSAAFEAITGPGVYVIEAPMGMGKTEAALWCAYRLISEGKATGLYFALPTQVTSNRIHLRVEDFIALICPDDAQVRLIHANSWLREEVINPRLAATARKDKSEDDARAGRDWFASGKRALLAPFGVGTVDQALLAVVAAKHFFVRRFALAGKVVVIDEVHSYDVYTGTLIRILCNTLEALGCTIILLSATLTATRRTALLGTTQIETDPAEEPYPLITGRSSCGNEITPRIIEQPKSKAIYPSFVNEEVALKSAWDAAINGACVLWICNTIGSAQRIHRRFLECRGGHGPDVGLLHSRFPYFRREILEQNWMGRLGKGRTDRTGCVLVATQVVEQSVDLDADLLVTELAPTDMMLQRIGRLWRHPRVDRPLARAECWIIEPPILLDSLRSLPGKVITEHLKPNSNVYDPYVLLRSWEVWSVRHKVSQMIAVPGDIRRLLEDTYRERSDEPMGWETLRSDIEGERYACKIFAETNSLIWKPLVDDIEGGAKTRLNGQETVALVLARSWDGKIAELLNGETVNLAADEYCIATARALHRNLVKLPKWVVSDFKITESSVRYLFGEQAIVTVGVDGAVAINGLKAGYLLRYSEDIGLAIESNKEDSNDESGL